MANWWAPYMGLIVFGRGGPKAGDAKFVEEVHKNVVNRIYFRKVLSRFCLLKFLEAAQDRSSWQDLT